MIETFDWFTYVEFLLKTFCELLLTPPFNFVTYCCFGFVGIVLLYSFILLLSGNSR